MSEWKQCQRKRAVIEAMQFDPHSYPWPHEVIAWAYSDLQPRDMSWGYLKDRGEEWHVHAGDWICKANGKIWVVEADCFDELYEVAE